jgi:alanine dehydrogenase
VRQLAESGWRGAPQANPALRAGLNIALGDVVHAAIADLYDLPLRPVTSLLEGTEAAVHG